MMVTLNSPARTFVRGVGQDDITKDPRYQKVMRGFWTAGILGIVGGFALGVAVWEVFGKDVKKALKRK